MGFFPKKKGERTAILGIGTGRSHQLPIPTIKLKDSEEENNYQPQRRSTKRIRRNFFKRAPRKPVFRRLDEIGPSPRNEYQPPTGFTAHSPLVKTKKRNHETTNDAKLPITQTQRTEAIKMRALSKGSMDESSNEYIPPPDFGLSAQLTGQTASIKSVPSFLSAKTGEGQEFRQFVFDPEFKKIEKVAVERSDPGGFVDFAQAASKMTPLRSTKKLRTSKSKTPADASKRSELLKEKLPDTQLFATISEENLALQQENEAKNRHPPQAFVISSNQSVVSNVSVANATVTDLIECHAFPTGHPFNSFPDDEASDPFKNGAWLSDESECCMSWNNDPFSSRNITSPVMEDPLIESIKKAASSGRNNNDDGSSKPDPSPKGSASSDSRRSSAQYRLSNEIASNDFKNDMGSFIKEEKPPTCLPQNAILGSMIFRHAGSDSDGTGVWNSCKIPLLDEDIEDDDDDVKVRGIPTSIIHAEKRDDKSSVSSVTDEASVFYQKNLLWKQQAQSVLNQWHQAKLRENRNPNTYRADAPQQGLNEDLQQLNIIREHLNMFSA